MRYFILLCTLAGSSLAGLALAQFDPVPSRVGPQDPQNVRLPNGKTLRDEVLKANHEKNLKDAAEMQRLSAEIKDDLEKTEGYVYPLKTLKKLEDVEKLSKAIQERLKKN